MTKREKELMDVIQHEAGKIIGIYQNDRQPDRAGKMQECHQRLMEAIYKIQKIT